MIFPLCSCNTQFQDRSSDIFTLQQAKSLYFTLNNPPEAELYGMFENACKLCCSHMRRVQKRFLMFNSVNYIKAMKSDTLLRLTNHKLYSPIHLAPIVILAKSLLSPIIAQFISRLLTIYNVKKKTPKPQQYLWSILIMKIIGNYQFEYF